MKPTPEAFFHISRLFAAAWETYSQAIFPRWGHATELYGVIGGANLIQRDSRFRVTELLEQVPARLRRRTTANVIRYYNPTLLKRGS